MATKNDLSLAGISAVKNQRSPKDAEAAMLQPESPARRSALDMLADDVSFTGKTSQPSSASISVGQVIHVPLQEVDPNPHNARRLRSTTWIETLAASLVSDGQQVPVAAFMSTTGRYTLIDGETRRLAAIKAGIPTLKIHLHERPASDAELYRLSRTLNAERKDMSILDDAYAWRELLDQKIYASSADLARTLGISEEHVSNVLGMTQLPPSILAILDDLADPPGIRWLIAFKSYLASAGEEGAITLLARHRSEPLSSREVSAMRVRLLAASKQRTRFQHVKFEGHVKGALKLSENGTRLSLSLSIDDNENLDELAGEIERLVKRLEKGQEKKGG